MLNNHLKMALRSLLKRKGYAVLNIAGLAIGVACCALIFLFIRNELAVNQVFPNVEHLYRIDSEWREPTMGLHLTTLAPVGQTLVDEYPQVIDQSRIYAMFVDIRVGDAGLRRDAWIADPSIVRMLDLPLIAGNAETALTQPRSVIIRETVAQDVFGTTDVVGRSLRLNTWQNGEQDYTITGVWRKLPYNSLTRMVGSDYEVLLPSPLISQDFIGEGGFTSWQSRYMVVLAETAPQVTSEAMQNVLAGFVERYAPESYHGDLNLSAQSIVSLHLDDNSGRGWRVVWVLATLAALLLLIASINFTNLATAQSLGRSREIGVRKAVGARRTQLIIQFLSEACLVALFATVLGGLFAAVALDGFFELAKAELVLEQPWDATTLGAFLGIALMTGVLAGAYPAFFIAGFEPIKSLKGKLAVSPSSVWLRKGLVVAQFTIAIGLLLGVTVITQQIDFILQQDVGYDKEDLFVVTSVPRNWTPEGVRRMETMRAAFERLPGVESVSLTYDTPTYGWGTGNTNRLRLPGQDAEQGVAMTSFGVDNAFLSTYGLRLAEGQFFGADPSPNDNGVVINQAAARALGLDFLTDPTVILGDSARVSVIGIVDDFHFAHLKEPLRPLLLQSVRATSLYRNFTFRLAGEDTQATVAGIEALWQELFPGAAMEYDFIDQQLAGMYEADEQVKWIVGLASALAVLIACLGMLGMASLTVVQRTKEMGVRKVLGASEVALVGLLTKDFLLPLVIAFVLASPLAYFALEYWLTNFALRVSMDAWTFLVIGGIATTLAWGTIAYHTLTAARANPVKCLRYE